MKYWNYLFANNAFTLWPILCKHCKLSVQILRKYLKNIKNMTKKYEIQNKYQPSGEGGTRSPPAMPHRLQHLIARLIQNGRQGLERG